MGLFSRLLLALSLPFRLIFSAATASTVRGALDSSHAASAEETATAASETALPETTSSVSALQLLALLQREGRFIDFIEEDVSGFDDNEIGAAARVVHEGCRRALKQHFEFETIRPEPEGERVTLAEGFDPSAHRVTGNVKGTPPFTGELAHPGWRARTVNLPDLVPGFDPTILAPAEIEL